MNKLSTAERVKVIAALVEGNSINSTVRMTGISKPTILKLIVELGDACREFHNEHVCHLLTERVQCDETWAFCYAKANNVPADKKGQFGFGDVWTWTAIDADSKLMIGWLIGRRDSQCANIFLRDVASRLARKVQLTSDGHHTYMNAVGNQFEDDVDYAQIVKIYGTERVGEARYSPPVCIGCKKQTRIGNPNPKHISTSFVERSNLTVRMGMRRYTRLTNGFSKKVENHDFMTSIFFTYYNFCRIHQTLRVTPAMQAGLAKEVWEIEKLVSLLN